VSTGVPGYQRTAADDAVRIQAHRVRVPSAQIGAALTDSCAWGYQNEGEVGEGIKNSGIDRSELFITSKLFEIHHHPEHVELAIKDTLKKLGTDYLDLYLMHWNVSGCAANEQSSG